MIEDDSIRIVKAGDAGFTLIQGSRQWNEHWDRVECVVVTEVPWGDYTALAMAIAMTGSDQCILVYEVEAVWHDWMETAEATLPGMLLPEIWEPELKTIDQGMVIYQRTDIPRTVMH